MADPERGGPGGQAQRPRVDTCGSNPSTDNKPTKNQSGLSAASMNSWASLTRQTSVGVAHKKLIRAATGGRNEAGSTFGWASISLIQWKGSVFPSALRVAVPCAMCAAIVRVLMTEDILNWDRLGLHRPLAEYAAWSGFSFLVGFLVVFRTSQAYSRFWDGCTSSHTMRAEWFDACSSIVAFTRHSTVEEMAVVKFRHLLVRLFSILHAMALAELEDSDGEMLEDVEAFGYSLIDIESLDEGSLQALRCSENKVELVFQWIQCFIVENIKTGVLSVPPPILSRAFQELASGMVAFHDAQKISLIPFPFPYGQTCDCLLFIHWIVSPFVVSLWVEHWFWAFTFTFIQVFILWALNFIALEIQNPFGMDENDLDSHTLQNNLNQALLLLISKEALTTPHLTDFANLNVDNLKNGRSSASLRDIWDSQDPTTKEDGRALPKAKKPSSGVGSHQKKSQQKTPSQPPEAPPATHSVDPADPVKPAIVELEGIRLEAAAPPSGSGHGVPADPQDASASLFVEGPAECVSPDVPGLPPPDAGASDHHAAAGDRGQPDGDGRPTALTIELNEPLASM